MAVPEEGLDVVLITPLPPDVALQTAFKTASETASQTAPTEDFSVPEGQGEAPVAPATAVPLDHLSPEAVLADYRLAWESRHASLLGRREVLTGKAKFGIFGDGKEVAQLAMARAFRPGDFRSGYYRDQTFMMALGALTLEQFFAQLYADPDEGREPCSAGRSMNGHFSTCFLDADGSFHDLTARYNSSADVSPTGSQMPRLVGLAYASRLFREVPVLAGLERLSRGGSEIAFGTIGNASCAEGMFWESVNAVGVLRSPMLLSIWDDGYGISVPNELQVTKGDLSALLSGFRRAHGEAQGFEMRTVCGWDYPALLAVYQEVAETVRREHVPAILHVVELTQPQGHSTSGSHERYKSKERLAWESEYDCLRRMRLWILEVGLAQPAELDAIEEEAKARVRQCQESAWRDFRADRRGEGGAPRPPRAARGRHGERGGGDRCRAPGALPAAGVAAPRSPGRGERRPLRHRRGGARRPRGTPGNYRVEAPADRGQPRALRLAPPQPDRPGGAQRPGRPRGLP